MVLERLAISDPEEDAAMHIHCSGLPGDRAFDQMVLKKPFIR